MSLKRVLEEAVIRHKAHSLFDSLSIEEYQEFISSREERGSQLVQIGWKSDGQMAGNGVSK